MSDSKNKRSRRSKWIVFGLIAFVLYGLAVRTTDVDFAQVRSEIRQTQLTRILRALAHPDLVSYERDEVSIEALLQVPCAGEPPAGDTSGAYIVLTPTCASPGEEVVIHGYNFEANSDGIARFIPDSEIPVTIRLEPFSAGEDGEFEITIKTPDRESTKPQQVLAVTAQPVGTWLNRASVVNEETGETLLSPRFSQNGIDTLDKIIETVFMALLATTVGTLLALPLSFIAARNLMRDISMTITGLATILISVPFGLWGGIQVARWINDALGIVSSSRWLLAVLVTAIPLTIIFAIRAVFNEDDTEEKTRTERIQQGTVTAVAGVAGIFWLGALAQLLKAIGHPLPPQAQQGFWDFIPNFIYVLGDVGELTLVVITTLVGLRVAAKFASRLADSLTSRRSKGSLDIINVPLAAVAGGVSAVLIMRVVDWFYNYRDPVITLWAPIAIGALLGAFLALRNRTLGTVNVGLLSYYAARTVFNTLRSIEPLIMVIVAVVWVGFGPFAGSIALALHTTASLAKLYSEQVENIDQGHVEAIRATGATRLQTIMYGVVPQITPPYLSFTMYRWDINVRMSTIIGFAGGGGIGFLLSQNINLLEYRDAAAQMLAIAIVVATMDWISARLRERLV